MQLNHTRKGNSRPPCIFHLRGACNKGASCQFSHNHTQSLEDLVLCRYHISGACRYGEYCQLAHGLPCPHCKSNMLHPHNKQLSNHMFGGDCKQRKQIWVNESTKKQTKEARKEKMANYFISAGCDHAFCIGCIRLWRNKSNDVSNPSAMVKACPTCRKDSLFIIPSLIYCTGEMKQHIVDQYKSNMKYKACKYFAKAASCPFGADCFYAHYNQDGSLADTSNMKNVVKNRHNRYNNNSRLEFHSYEMDVVNLLSQLSHMSPTYVMELLMDMLADEDEDWVDY